MAKVSKTIFKIAREEAGLTQEEAAERLPVGNATMISRYENGSRIPQEDLVACMMQVYDAKWLGYVYLQQYTTIGKLLLPPIQWDDLGLSVLKFQKEYDDVENIKKQIVAVACDGVITQDECEIWDLSMTELRELVTAATSLLLKKEMPQQDGRLVRAFG